MTTAAEPDDERRATMKHVLIGQASGATMDEIMAVFPRHKIVVDEFVARGEVIGIGPLGEGGNMAIFRSIEAAEEFARRDPFILEGLVSDHTIQPWLDRMLT
jgi:uncharacterized protein YciI